MDEKANKPRTQANILHSVGVAVSVIVASPRFVRPRNRQTYCTFFNTNYHNVRKKQIYPLTET